MFPTAIKQDATPFTATPADNIFHSICGCTFSGDHSFIATLRVLLKGRIHECDMLTMLLTESPSIRSSYDDANSLLSHIFKHVPKQEIAIVNLDQYSEQAEASMKVFDDTLSGSAFILQPDISLLMEQTMLVNHCRIYVNYDEKACVVLVNMLSLRAWHTLQCLIPRMLPAYFGNNRLSMQEQEVIRSLNMETCECYLETIKKMAEGIDIES